MSSRSLILCLAVILLSGMTLAADKQSVQVVRIGDLPVNNLIESTGLATADTCYVTENDVITTRIDGWVTGFELYKSWMDPAADCENAYPFTITAINLPMMFDAATPLTIAADIEEADTTTIAGCPVPGAVLAVSSQYDTQVPGAGFYHIWIPLDTPIVVNGPVFAGFYIGNAFDASVNPAVLCDDYPATCATYNIWDENVGWIDLGNNTYWNFPGRLAMEIAGFPGGSANTEPVLEVLTPTQGDVLMGSTEFWVWDKGMTGVADHVIFEYSDGGPFVEIGRDYDGSSVLRDGVNPTTGGSGFSLPWDFSMLPEGNYQLRTTLVDTAGQEFAATISAYLEPTPPIARIITPSETGPFCAPVTIDLTSTDEDLSFVELYHRDAALLHQLEIDALWQSAVGDANGNPLDENIAANGEFGDYYSGPVAAAMAANIWADRGYAAIISQGSSALSSTEVAEAIAELVFTRTTLGTYDEAFYSGLRSYVAAHGGGFSIDRHSDPEYNDLRKWMEHEGRVVMLGVSGPRGFWLTVDGFIGFDRPDNTWLVSVANPLTGTLQSVSWRNQGGSGEIYIDGVWHEVDLMISLLADDWTVPRQLLGADFNGADGWSHDWSASGLSANSFHYLHAIGHDAGGYQAPFTLLTEHDCASVYVPGDYDNDRLTDASDLFALIEFITHQGAAPHGGAQRADCNCDNVVNIADIIFYMNYLYGAAGTPCR